MNTTLLKFRLLKPVLNLYGPGDRGPGGGGPASFPGEEPLLPRLETLIGAAGVSVAEKHGLVDFFDRVQTYEEYLERIEDLLGLGRGVFIGPFLLVETPEDGEKGVYVDVGTGLLKIIEKKEDNITISRSYNKYSYKSRILYEIDEMDSRDTILRPPSALFREISPYTPETDDRSLLPGYVAREDILIYRTGIALDRREKRPKEHMIYTLPRIDYSAISPIPGTKYTLIVLHKSPNNEKASPPVPVETIIYGGISVKQAPTIIEIKNTEEGTGTSGIIEKILELTPPVIGVHPDIDCSKTYLAISPTAIPAASAYHPVIGKPVYIRLGRTYTCGKLFKHYRKDQPLTALAPGNLFKPAGYSCIKSENRLVKYIRTLF